MNKLTCKDILEAPITANLFKIAFNDDFVFNQWLPALRSGEYHQAQGFLHLRGRNGAKGSFCCLGVGCDLMAPGIWELMSGENNSIMTHQGNHLDSSEFNKFVGFRDCGTFGIMLEYEDEHEDVRINLATLNDGSTEFSSAQVERLPFTEIADIIEHHAKEAIKLRGHS